MAVHIEHMTDASAASTASPNANLLRRLLLQAVVMVEAAIGLAYLAHALQDRWPAWAMVALSDSLTGLAAGLSARWILRRQSGPLRLAAALATLVGGMVFQGWLTSWQVGLGPLEIGRSLPDWMGLGQFSLGMGMALLALYGWQRSPLRVDVAPAAAPRPVRRPARARSRPQSVLSPLPRRAARSRARTRSGMVSRGRRTDVLAKPVAVPEKQARTKGRRGLRRKAQLQFISKEEHRCPYCLELVEEHDPRGSVECKVCHTLHHADCWAITGTCQVPHLNN